MKINENLEAKLFLTGFFIAFFIFIPLAIITNNKSWAVLMYITLCIIFIFGIIAHRHEVKDWNWKP